MNINNISTQYNQTQNNNPVPPRRRSILKPLLYTYFTALAIMPVDKGDYFEKQEKLQETKDKIRKSPFTNEDDSYLKERFASKDKNKNTFYQLQMANLVDQAQMEKVSDDKFRYSIRVDSKKINGKLKFANKDKALYGTAVIYDLSKELSKSKEFKFKIILPNKKSNTFLMKILDNTDTGTIYKLKRENDGRLILNDGKDDTTINPINAEVYQAIRDIERNLSDQAYNIANAKENQKKLQLIMSIIFLLEFLTGTTREKSNQEQ